VTHKKKIKLVCGRCYHFWLNKGDCAGACNDVAKKCEDFKKYKIYYTSCSCKGKK